MAQFCVDLPLTRAWAFVHPWMLYSCPCQFDRREIANPIQSRSGRHYTVSCHSSHIFV